MGQKGFWDEQERREKLNQKKPIQRWLNENINWEHFRPILKTIYDKERKSNAGRKPTDVIVMFKLFTSFKQICDIRFYLQTHSQNGIEVLRVPKKCCISFK